MSAEFARVLVDSIDETSLDVLADRLAERFAFRLSPPNAAANGNRYMTPSAAAVYLGITRKRLYDLKSMGAIEPDGFDGRTPLFIRETLDAYVSPRRRR